MKAIGFGKDKREREEADRQKEEQASWEYQHRRQAAEALGFTSAGRAQELARMEKEDPKFISEVISSWKAKKQRERTQLQQESIPFDKALSEVFSVPGKDTDSARSGNEGFSPNPSRRREKTQEEITDAIANEDKRQERFSFALRKKWKGKNDQVRVDFVEWYGGQCQICDQTFTQKNGEAFFEGLYLVSYTTAEWRDRVGNVLCLCAQHSAMFQFGPKEVEKNVIQQVMRLKTKAEGGNGHPSIQMKLCGDPVRIKFAEKHFIDLQEMIEKSLS